jgi:uncharacterized protein (TIGR02466 family)|tara:strand:+ start:44 stop:658 length:615 start_codon:yes stop_codon:yes gene_type:complete
VSIKYTLTNLFPSPVHIFDTDGFDEFKNNLIDYAYKLREEDSKGFNISNRHGWQSRGFDLTNMNDLLHGTILQGLSSFPSIKNTTEMRASAWININGPGAYNILHSHPNSHLSGVMWIKAPKNCGVISFDNPNGHQTYTEINSYNQEFNDQFFIHHSYWLPPIEGRMIIFPSHLQHEVRENNSNEDRISVSFNITLTSSTQGRF